MAGDCQDVLRFDSGDIADMGSRPADFPCPQGMFRKVVVQTGPEELIPDFLDARPHGCRERPRRNVDVAYLSAQRLADRVRDVLAQRRLGTPSGMKRSQQASDGPLFDINLTLY